MEVVIAIIAAATAIVVESIRRGILDRRFMKTVGKANGRGSVVQMNEQQLDMIESLQESVKTVEQHRVDAERKLADMASAVAAMNFNMQGVTRFQNLISGVRLDFEGRFDEIARALDDLDKRTTAIEEHHAKVGVGRFKVPHLPSRHIDHDVNE